MYVAQGNTAVKKPTGGTLSKIDNYKVEYNGWEYQVPAQVLTFKRGDLLYWSATMDNTYYGLTAWQPVIALIAPTGSDVNTLRTATFLKTKNGRSVTQYDQNWAFSAFPYCDNPSKLDGYVDPVTGAYSSDYVAGYSPMRILWNGVQPYFDTMPDGSITTAYCVDWNGDGNYDQAFIIKIEPGTGFALDNEGGLKAVRYNSRGALAGGYASLRDAVMAMENNESAVLVNNDSGQGFSFSSTDNPKDDTKLYNKYTIDVNGYNYMFTSQIAEPFNYGIYNPACNITLKNSGGEKGSFSVAPETSLDKLMYNYGTLTIDNVKLDGTNVAGAYTLYSSNGDVNISRSKLIAPEGGYALGAGCRTGLIANKETVTKTTRVTLSDDTVFDTAYIYNGLDYNTDTFITWGKSIRENRLGAWAQDQKTKTLVRGDVRSSVGPVSYVAKVQDASTIAASYRSNMEAVLNGMSFAGQGFADAAAVVADSKTLIDAQDKFRADKANPSLVNVTFATSTDLNNVMILPKLNVNILSLNSNGFEYDITAKYDLYVTSVDNYDEIILLEDVRGGVKTGAVNAIKYNPDKELPVEGAIDTTITVPNRFFSDNSGVKDFYIFHYKDSAAKDEAPGSYYAYNTTITKITNANLSTVAYTDKHGFSTFELTAQTPGLPINFENEYFNNLQDAVDAVNGAATITIKAPSNNEDGSYSAAVGSIKPGKQKIITVAYDKGVTKETAPIYISNAEGCAMWELEDVEGHEMFVALAGPSMIDANGDEVLDANGNTKYFSSLNDALQGVKDTETIVINGSSNLVRWTASLNKAANFNVVASDAVANAMTDAKVEIGLVEGLKLDETSDVSTMGYGSYVVTGEPLVVEAPLSRLSGQTALATMEQIIRDSYSKGSCRYAVLATNNTFQDALSASGLAGLLNAPIILTEGDNLSIEAFDTIKYLKSARGMTVIAVGGPMSISNQVLSDVDAIASVSVKRVSGQTAWDTSLAVYNYGVQLSKGNVTVKPWSDNVVLCTSKTFEDALSISPYSYSKNAPIILTNSDNVISADAVSTVRAFKQVIIAGGEVSVSPTVNTQLGKIHTRLQGDDAYGTSNAIAEWALKYGGMSAAKPGVATGRDYRDALVASAHCGKSSSPIILADESNLTTVDAQGDSFLKKNARSITNVRIYGGKLSVSEDVEKRIKSNILG